MYVELQFQSTALYIQTIVIPRQEITNVNPLPT